MFVIARWACRIEVIGLDNSMRIKSTGFEILEMSFGKGFRRAYRQLSFALISFGRRKDGVVEVGSFILSEDSESVRPRNPVHSFNQFYYITLFPAFETRKSFCVQIYAQVIGRIDTKDAVYSDPSSRYIFSGIRDIDIPVL
jgi:hypothetical protein